MNKDAAREPLLHCAAIVGLLHLWIHQDRCQGRQIRMLHSHSSAQRCCSLHRRCCCHLSATCALQRFRLHDWWEAPGFGTRGIHLGASLVVRDEPAENIARYGDLQLRFQIILSADMQWRCTCTVLNIAHDSCRSHACVSE